MKRSVLFLTAFIAIFAWQACQKDKQSPGSTQEEVAAIAAANADEPGGGPETIAPCCIPENGNVIRDPGFTSILPAHFYTSINPPLPCNNLKLFTHANRNPHWFASPYMNSGNIVYNTPQVPVNNCTALQLIAGGCDVGSILFWGNQVTGESVTQSGLQLTPNYPYKIKFNARVRPGSADTAYIAMRFSNQVPSGTTDVRNIPPGSSLAFGNNSVPVRSDAILSQNWECYTMPLPLTSNLAYNMLHVYPVNKLTANGSWAIVEIDNIQVY